MGKMFEPVQPAVPDADATAIYTYPKLAFIILLKRRYITACQAVAVIGIVVECGKDPLTGTDTIEPAP
jgi:hypothetical protein